jgi:hypothetical protein
MLAAENAEKKIEIEKDNNWNNPKPNRMLTTVGGSNDLNGDMTSQVEHPEFDAFSGMFTRIYVFVYIHI